MAAVVVEEAEVQFHTYGVARLAFTLLRKIAAVAA